MSTSPPYDESFYEVTIKSPHGAGLLIQIAPQLFEDPGVDVGGYIGGHISQNHKRLTDPNYKER